MVACTIIYIGNVFNKFTQPSTYSDNDIKKNCVLSLFLNLISHLFISYDNIA